MKSTPLIKGVKQFSIVQNKNKKNKSQITLVKDDFAKKIYPYAKNSRSHYKIGNQDIELNYVVIEKRKKKRKKIEYKNLKGIKNIIPKDYVEDLSTFQRVVN